MFTSGARICQGPFCVLPKVPSSTNRFRALTKSTVSWMLLTCESISNCRELESRARPEAQLRRPFGLTLSAHWVCRLSQPPPPDSVFRTRCRNLMLEAFLESSIAPVPVFRVPITGH